MRGISIKSFRVHWLAEKWVWVREYSTIQSSTEIQSCRGLLVSIDSSFACIIRSGVGAVEEITPQLHSFGNNNKVC